jgi:hypothetical protein
LCNVGQPSPYLAMVFPNRLFQYREYFDLQDLPPEEVDQWKRCFLRFLKQITVRNSKRIVLKSPTHTYRVKILLELFPNARFVHIVRDPYVVFPSTMNMWQTNYLLQGLQHPTFEGLEEYVFDNFVRMYEKLDEVRPLIDRSRFYELRYEDLVRNPIEQLRAIYENLELGNFEQVLPKLKQYIANTSDYKTNRYELPTELWEAITARWGDVIRRYGYQCGGDI